MAGQTSSLEMRPVFSIILLGVLFGLNGRAGAQNTVVLTLESSIERAQDHSPMAEVARLRLEESSWLHESFRSQYLPNIALMGNGPGLVRSISEIVQDDGSMRYVPQSRTFSTVNLAVEQPIAPTGGSLFFSSRLSRIDLFGDFSSNQWQAAPLVVGISQPLFQFNQMRWERRIEPMRYQLARRIYAEDMAMLAVEITNRFFEVYIAQINVHNAGFNVAVNDTIYTLSEGRYELGRIAENDLLQSELALLNAQAALSDAQIAHDRAMQNLKTALDLPAEIEVEIIPPFDVPLFDVSPVEAVELAHMNRAAFLQFEIATLEADRNVAMSRQANKFAADLTMSYGLNQSSDRLGDLYSNPLNQQQFSVGFRIPLYQFGRGKADFEAAMANYDRINRSAALQRAELEHEVHFEALQFLQLQRQVQVAAKADTVAARRFEVARNRYTIGRIDITNLFDAQQAKDLASQAYVRTLHQYWVSYFRLRRLTLYDFARNEPLTPLRD